MRVPTSSDYRNHPLTRVIAVSDLVSADLVCGPKNECQFHNHDAAFEICYCISGKTLVSRDGELSAIVPGQCVLIAPKVTHGSIQSDEDDMSFYISFSCKGDSLYLLTNGVHALDDDQTSLLDRIISELFGAYKLNEDGLRLFNFTTRENMPMGAEQLISTYLEQFFILLFRTVTMKHGRVISSSQLEQAKESYLVENIKKYISDNISQPLTVDDIVNTFHYSRSRLFELFKRSSGYSIGRYISLQQLNLAKELLLQGKYSTAKISEMAGFASPQYFSRKFKEEVGRPPSQYAKKGTDGGAAAEP